MTIKHQIILSFVKDLSVETPDAESLIFARENISKFPTCSMFCIEFDVKHWSQVEKGRKLFMFYQN